MSLYRLLDHQCDIYRLVSTDSRSEYALPIEQPDEYTKKPIAVDVPCHFEEVSQDVIQGEPETRILHRFRVTFLPDADIKLHDRVEWDGASYKLQKPKDVRGHHLIVTATRSEPL
ncbi:DUF3599 family protein [Shouchella clausii]|uniref:DUF3599 family protein n=1 Tax=Shouchella clausii TaxID=79880 RepID=UPI001C73C8A7|nr:DUF3599 family protein [Shouchella clausii]MBX0319755.1 YqbH/XkdH family protein [Shouchella clausii]